MLLVGIGFIGFSLWAATLSFFGIVLITAVIGLGGVFAWTPTTSMALGAVAKNNLAVGASILFTSSQVGAQMSQALFIVVIGSFVGGAAEQIFRTGSNPSASEISSGIFGMQVVFQLSTIVMFVGLLLALLTFRYRKSFK